MLIKEQFMAQKSYFLQGETRGVSFRIEMLKKLKSLIKENQAEIDNSLKKIKKWVRPKRVSTPAILLPAKSLLYPELLGLVLIISPWNYPFLLALAPLIGAMSAGNCCIVKPSELTPSTSKVIAKIINQNFPEKYLLVLEGGVDITTALLKEKFNHIFFTGSPGVGKIIMQAAALHLTPVTLELGGKSPCIVDDTANIDLAAKKIVWGNFLNAGQTCVAKLLLVESQ